MLENNDPFPPLAFARAGGGEIHLPGDLAGGFGVILFYRGAWSNACNAQLNAYAKAAGEFAAWRIGVVAVSVDGQEDAEGLVARYGLPFPVGYAADPQAVSAVTGVLVNEDTAYLEAAGFILTPEGRVHTAVYSSTEGFEERIVTVVYSSAAVGRLMPGDVLRVVGAATSAGQD